MTLNYKVEGQAKLSATPIVLLHGLFGSLENLSGLAGRLANDFRVYSVDLPNHGHSAHFDFLTLADHASVFAEWLDRQGLPSVALWGHSLGGKVAMEVALSSPERVTKLAVADISPVAYQRRHDDIFEALKSLQIDVLKSRKEADEQLKAKIPDTAIRGFLLKNLVKSANGFYWRCNIAGIKASYGELINENLAGNYLRPALFLKGQNSNYITDDHRSAVEQRFSDVTLKIITDAEHWIHAEKPDLVARITRQFFSI